MDVFASPEKADSVLDLVGGTPIVKIDRLNPNSSVDIYAKLEGFNPGGSVKDRVTKKMIEEAEESGELTKDRTILEPTSGNTGIGLAMVANRKGYDATFVMPACVSTERALMLKAFGADVMVTPGCEGTDGAIKMAEKLLEENDKYWMPDQFSNEANVRAHYENTGPEIWEATQGEVTHFVAGMGTCGTIVGVGKYLKEKDSSIKVIGVQPKAKNGIQGLKNIEESITPEIYEKDLLDRELKVDPGESYRWTSKLVRKEGIFVGQSSGAAMLASRKIARWINEGTIVTVFPDFGFKYLTSRPYHDEKVIEKLEEARKEEKSVKV